MSKVLSLSVEFLISSCAPLAAASTIPYQSLLDTLWSPAVSLLMRSRHAFLAFALTVILSDCNFKRISATESATDIIDKVQCNNYSNLCGHFVVLELASNWLPCTIWQRFAIWLHLFSPQKSHHHHGHNLTNDGRANVKLRETCQSSFPFHTTIFYTSTGIRGAVIQANDPGQRPGQNT